MAQASRGDIWEALWIWGSPGLAMDHRNEYCCFRRTFTLPAEPLRAPVRVTADNRYQLFVNGQLVCRGPARCIPRFQAYDEIDLAPYLKRGRNCIAALAHHYGESTFQSLERGGWGFLLDGEVRCRGAKPVPLHTGSSWKAIRAESYNPKTARYTVQLGFQEDFDAARLPEGWNATRFSDRDWPTARIIGAAHVMPYEHLEPRGIPFAIESPEQFAGATGTFTGRCLDGYGTREDLGLLIADEQHRPDRDGVCRDVESCLKPSRGHMTVRPTPAGRFHAVVLDAGHETAGFLHLDVEAHGGEIIDVFYTEHVRPDGSAVRRARNGALAAIADRYRCRKGRQRHQFFAWKGFRYVLLVFRDVKRPLRVRHVGYTFTSYPVERRGSFECSDPLLNRIWETGVWTQQLCMHDAYMDCPWREQAQWWGDARVQWRVNMAVFGDHALFKRGLRQAAQSQVFHGLTYGLFPCETHSCILPDYTLTWICSLWDYYFHTGDDGPIREHYDAVMRALGWFERHTGRARLCGYPDAGLWLFLDWAPLFKAGHNATFTLQYLEALQTVVRMAHLLRRPADARRCNATARAVARAAVRAFWDPGQKLFCEGREPDARRPFRQTGQHANAYAILTGVQPGHHRRLGEHLAWITRNFDLLRRDNTGGNLHHSNAHHPIASPFFFAYVLEAMLRTGFEHDAMWAIRTLWGRMLDEGATTWYESWDHTPETHGNTSACHAWSAGPTYHLSEQVGGIHPLAPGYARVRIAPRMFDLDHATVRKPTPRGVIEVDWERAGADAMDLKVKLPRGVQAALDVPGHRRRTLNPGTHRLRPGA